MSKIDNELFNNEKEKEQEELPPGTHENTQMLPLKKRETVL